MRWLAQKAILAGALRSRALWNAELPAVAVGRSHPTPVSHPVTLRTVVSEALGQDVDADLAARVKFFETILSIIY